MKKEMEIWKLNMLLNLDFELIPTEDGAEMRRKYPKEIRELIKNRIKTLTTK